MPELPEVEVFKRYFDDTSLSQKISDISVRSKEILEGVSERKLKAAVKGTSFSETSRRGKYLFAKTTGKYSVMLHFGMTGFLKYFGDIDQDEPHNRLLISFANGYYLGFICQRLLGRIALLESTEEFIRQQNLGPDALEIGFSEFQKLLAESRTAVKAAIMKQQRVCGIGNIYADEILFQAGIHPGTKSSGLSTKEASKIYRSMLKVLQKAIDARAQPERMPSSFIIPHRGEDNKCPKCKRPLKRVKIGGRNAYFCANCQG